MPVPTSRPSRTWKHVLRRGGGFATSVLLLGLINVAVIPIVIRTAGTQLWAGIAVAQSIASFASVVVAFGWGVTGPSSVARLEVSERGRYFADSAVSRGWIAVVVVPVMAVIVLLVAPGESAANVLAAAALVLPAVGASWFFVGEKAPIRLFLFETVPRATGTLAGAALLLLQSPLWVFAGMQVLGAAAAVALSYTNVLRRHPTPAQLGLRDAIKRLRGQGDGVVAAVTAALYVSLPIVLAGLIVPIEVPVYAVADKLQKLIITAFGPVLQVAQGYVAVVDDRVTVQRARRMAKVASVLGVMIGAAFALIAGPAGSALSAGAVSVPLIVAISLGVALASICASAIVGLACLTALRAVRVVAASTVLGAAVGIPLLIVGGFVGGITGIAIAAGVSELAVTIYQLVRLRAITRVRQLAAA